MHDFTQLTTKIDHIFSQKTSKTEAYYLIGEYIFMHVQSGNLKAKYGTKTLKNISLQLTNKYGKGFSLRTLTNMRKLFLFSPIRQTPLLGMLTWSHFLQILKARSPAEIQFYIQQTQQNNWSTRQLKHAMNQKAQTQMASLEKGDSP